MSVKLSITGNGKFSTTNQSDVVISYSLSEGATPTAPVDTSGEIPNLGISGESNDIQTLGQTHPSSKLLLNNTLEFTDSVRGVFNGKIVSSSLSNNIASINAQSRFELLNSVKKADVFIGNLSEAFGYYLELGGLNSTDYEIDSSLESIDVIYPGWNENVWVQLKLLCATTKVEMYFQENKVKVAPVAAKEFILKNSQTESFSAEIPGSTKSFYSTLGKTTYIQDGILKAFAPGEDAGKVEPNEVKEEIVPVQFSITPDSLNQPEYTTVLPELYRIYVEKDSLGTVPTEYPNGFYCFCDKNGKRVPEQSVINSGAGIELETTDNPFEIKVKIIGPNSESDTPWSLDFVAGSDSTPALMITGSGIRVKRTEYFFPTGADEGDEEKRFAYNPFIIDKDYLYSSAARSSQKLSGPNVSIALSTDAIDEAGGQEFGFASGAIIDWDKSKYRIASATYSYGSVSIDASQYVTFDNFNETWNGLGFDEFTDIMFDSETNPDEAMSFNDFAVIPLMEPF